MDRKSQRKLMGKRVTFTKVLVRDMDFRPGGSRAKTWKEQFCAPQKGWVVGFRSLRNGVATWEGEEVGTAWTSEGAPVPCVLVALQPDQLPKRVPLLEIVKP